MHIRTVVSTYFCCQMTASFLLENLGTCRQEDSQLRKRGIASKQLKIFEEMLAVRGCYAKLSLGNQTWLFGSLESLADLTHAGIEHSYPIFQLSNLIHWLISCADTNFWICRVCSMELAAFGGCLVDAWSPHCFKSPPPRMLKRHKYQPEAGMVR